MASPRQAEQVDITQFFSDSTTQLLLGRLQAGVGQPGPDKRAPPLCCTAE